MEPTHCNVCDTTSLTTVYRSPDGQSLTSLCEIRDEPTEVFFCHRCGHMQTTPLTDVERYYDNDYRISLESDEDDQLYQVIDGNPVYRVQHQVATLLNKLAPHNGATLLDYGCAKSASVRELLKVRPDIVPYLFDVSEMYVPFWKKFVAPENWACYRPKAAWQQSFDIVTSFFSLEHVTAPSVMLREIESMLRPGGTFYCVVPNTFTNLADFIVIDHANHFSKPSLRFLLLSAGFDVVSIDDTAHAGAFVAIASKPAVPRSAPALTPGDAEIVALEKQVSELGGYWSKLSAKIRAFEDSQRPTYPVAIYGSGFYGTFIAHALKDRTRVRAFVDASPFRQGRNLLGIPVIAPASLPPEIDTILVGLNPLNARANIAGVTAWSGRSNCYFYL